MKCYYHKVDLDGKCSAAIVRRKYPECELIGVDYPDRPDFGKIEKSEKVFIVDFSFSAEDMYNLLCICNLIWIDHHKSAIQKVFEDTLPDNQALLTDAIEGIREIGKAGCELTWEYLFPDKPMPDAVRLLGRYDVGDHKDKDVIRFQYGMRLHYWFPEDRRWEKLLDPYLKEEEGFIKHGSVILTYEQQQNTAYAKAMAFPVEFEGHKAWAINKALSNSKIFETIEKAEERPLWILFSYKAGIWRYSLYANPAALDLDVSKLAVKYGGGGHAGAAGFQSNKYLLKE